MIRPIQYLRGFTSVGMIAIGGALLFAGDLFTGPRLIGASLIMAGSSMAGWLCYRWVEKPMTSRLHSIVKRHKASRDGLIATPGRTVALAPSPN